MIHLQTLNITIQRNINILQRYPNSRFKSQIPPYPVPSLQNHESPPHLFTIQSIPHRRSKIPKKKRNRDKN